MIGMKRAYSTSKNNINRYSSKGKDVSKHQSTSRHKSFEMHVGDTNTGLVNFPIVKQLDNAKHLQRYSAILARSAEDGVSMEDLDSLQQDFERLLSTCAIRNRLLRTEVELIDRVEDKSEKGKSGRNHVLPSEGELIDRGEEKRDKKGKPIEKQSLKRKRPDDKLRYRDGKNGIRVFKPRFANEKKNDMQFKHEVPKVTLPRNDTSDKFWSSIESYCADISRDDVNFLDDLIQECSQDINVKIPDIGEHYAMEWAESALNQEQTLSSTIGKPPKSKNMTFSNDFKKNGLNTMVDTFSSPLTQRLLAALLEEKVVKTFPSAFDKLKASDFTVKNNNGSRGGVCLDRRLRKELLEQGILDVDDLPKTYPPEDDILLEIKKCQQELSVVNEHNISELNKLRTGVAKDLRRQDVKSALNKVDNDIMTMYNNILVTCGKINILMSKQTLVTTDDDESDGKQATDDDEIDDKLNMVTSREYDDEANKLIKQQSLLHRELSELTDFSLIQ